MSVFASLFYSAAQLLSQTPPSRTTEQPEAVLPGDWGPELLDAILSSPNPEAGDALLHAAFAAGPAIIPQLEAALKDDRTAEFAAQSLAFIGGPKALEILSKLVNDPRDLDLRRFYYGSLGEFSTPEATQVLLDAVRQADSEPDRTVTEAAILALTLRSDPSLLPLLRQAQTKIKDVVIRDDLENALEVIEKRGHYLASPKGKQQEVSIERAVRIYFMPALELPPPPAPTKPQNRRPEAAAAKGRSAPTKRAEPEKPPVTVEIKSLSFSPDKSRALARVVFEDPSAMAYYDMVLQQQFGNWAIASVWLGPEVEKTPPAKRPPSTEPE